MKVLKAILKTLLRLVGITALLALLVALFIGACWVMGFVFKWICVTLATIMGAAAWAKFTSMLGTIFTWIMAIIIIGGILLMFALECKTQYDEDRAREKRRAEGWE